MPVTTFKARGTTSAHAENTHRPSQLGRGTWNYLRARGEYLGRHLRKIEQPELPPRTRRIPNSSASLIESSGTTSAHAENTKATL